MSKVIAYCRVSTDKQEVEGTSLESQQAAYIAKAQELAGPGDEVVVMRETYSGLTLERPELTKLRDWARNGQCKAVVTYSCDRLARDGLHLLLLIDEVEKSGAQVVFVTEPHTNTPEGQLLTYVRGWASKLEALKIKERTVRGKKQKARNGRFPFGARLYGYLYMKGKGESRGIRIPNTESGKIVQDIFSWYVQDGLSIEGIRKRLYTQGIPSPMGATQWHDSGILRLLRNPAYTGNTISHWNAGGVEETINISNATPALIGQGTFDSAQERLQFNKDNAKRRGKRDYLLRAMVFCDCGKRMVGASHVGIRRYRCTSHKRYADKHCGHTIIADNIESAVWTQIKGILANPEMIKDQISQRYGDTQGPADIEGQIKAIDARIKALDKGEQSIARQLRLGLMSEVNAEHELRQGKQDRETLEREKVKLISQLEGVKRWADLDIDGLCSNALLNLDNPGNEVKRAFLQAFDTRITVEGETIKVSVAFPIESTQGSSFELQPLRGMQR